MQRNAGPLRTNRHFNAMRLSPFVLISLLAIPGTGCHRSLLGGGDEGVIEYAMSFPDMDPNGLMADMLPDKTTLEFNRDHQSMDLSAGMGIFRTSMVVNTPAREVEYHMSVMGKSLVAVFKPRDLVNLNKVLPTLAVVHTLGRDTIAGLPCKQAYLIYDDISVPEAEVWYTEALSLETPNWYGPYNEIPGVLMRYEVVQHDVRMRLEATSVKMGAADARKFSMRPGHEQVPPEVLYQQLGEVLGTLGQ